MGQTAPSALVRAGHDEEIRGKVKHSKWDRRIRRADELAAVHPFATEVLQFYKHVTGLQQMLYLYFEDACDMTQRNSVPSSPRLDSSLDLLMPKFRQFLANLESLASQPIAAAAHELNVQQAGQHEDLLISCWENASDYQPALGKTEALLAWLFLQPYAENLADHSEHNLSRATSPHCPFCSGRPLVGVLRPEGDGAKRFLTCSLCSTEWAYGRIVCPACGEERVDKLAIYTATQFDHVRVEACDTCSHYIKTVDLTKNGRAVPVVDELATIPLNFWAYEHGYVKLQPNLLGI
jgi:formate dehydrogenase accessory protein FdhE